MATKKTTRTTTRKRSSAAEPSLQQQAEVLQQKLGESAQQIWLAGVGAFGRAQTEGTRMFDTLVKEGARVERSAGTRAGKARASLDEKIHSARAKAGETFGKVDQAFRSKVQGALKSLEVPTRRELGALIERIEALNGQLRKHNDAPVAKSAAKKTAARKTPAATARTAAKKTAAKKAAPRKAVKKTAAKTTRRPAARKPATS
ncbi:poly(hydroxyalkanoate) granule-associated protein [Pseudoxanthomonas sp. GM95]|uniref:phasin family protein n=1 Tax=Pseudoxanthomonas sp. GM95 TaxID=1881043 RepID=UPI0008B5C144|nr:phasin family protein [Pseudoxanthomonas sp. GM95]SEK95187.1 poly(hydroxyalkanoate) granule-associated protein [Pseudoxanthomonas sp. GM95]